MSAGPEAPALLPLFTSPDGELKVSCLGPCWLIFFRQILVFKSEPDDSDAAKLPEGLLFRRHGTYLLRNAWGEVRMPELGPEAQELLVELMSQRNPSAPREIKD